MKTMIRISICILLLAGLTGCGDFMNPNGTGTTKTTTTKNTVTNTSPVTTTAVTTTSGITSTSTSK